MKKLTMLASALALTLSMGQAYSADDPINSSEENNTIANHYVDHVTTDKAHLIESVQWEIGYYGNDEAKDMLGGNIPDWLGIAHSVADDLRDALKMTNSDSDEIKEAEDFVKEVLEVREKTYGHQGVELESYDEAVQDSIKAIIEKIPAKIERLKVLLDQLKSEEEAPKADESATKDENSAKEVSENDSKIEVEEPAAKDDSSDESSKVESDENAEKASVEASAGDGVAKDESNEESESSED